ncbi:MAG TPA: hypothetical protein VFY18_09010 [Candidatus Limnocylindrales bacterium]|nr:hypothetical protein [Candidatus Limnocylindrales bacterium]
MAVSLDPETRATRLAANVAAGAVVAFAVLWFLTTQVAAVRVLSPFAEDPWDAFATYAAIFLPFVAVPTWIRSLRHGGPTLPPVTGRRIRWGSGLAAGIVLVAAAADLHAIATVGWPAQAGLASDAMTALATIALLAAAAALVLTVRAARLAAVSDIAEEPERNAFEPDILDDLLHLATDVARPFGLRRPTARFAAGIERFLDGSAASPRRHRVLFGVGLAIAAAIAFDVWHAIREGPWASLVVPVMFGVLIASGIFAIYLGTLGPLRLLRPPAGDPARDYADAPL